MDARADGVAVPAEAGVAIEPVDPSPEQVEPELIARGAPECARDQDGKPAQLTSHRPCAHGAVVDLAFDHGEQEDRQVDQHGSQAPTAKSRGLRVGQHGANDARDARRLFVAESGSTPAPASRRRPVERQALPAARSGRRQTDPGRCRRPRAASRCRCRAGRSGRPARRASVRTRSTGSRRGCSDPEGRARRRGQVGERRSITPA